MIVQVGHYPPPIGGVSMYIKRMKDTLDSKRVENQVWDISHTKKEPKKNVIKVNFFLVPFYFLKRRDVKIIHFNISGLLTKNYIGFFNNLVFRRIKKIITIHGDCRSLFYRSNRFIKGSLNTFDAIICVQQDNAQYLRSVGVTSDLYEVPAFMPPKTDKKEIDEIPQKVWDFINTHSPIISANAYKIVFNRGEDLYGIDMCLELCSNLLKDYPKLGFIFSLPSVNDETYFEELKQRIQKKGIASNFIFQTKPCQLYPIVQKSDLFVRPTNTDGDAVSVREALHFNIPTIASDIAPRPPSTILFRNRDIADFIAKTKDVLSNYAFYKENLITAELADNFGMILKIYRELAKNKYKC